VQNLDDPAVIPSEHFNTVLYTGTGSSGNSITGVGFQPDWVWLKSRSNVNSHQVYDTVRGGSKILSTNGTGADYHYDNSLGFDSDGFTINNTFGNHNGLGTTYVSWNWKANGTGVSNTDGTITSTVSANTDAGFSIVSWTQTGYADSIGHGLNKIPDLIILKSRSATTANWWVYTNTGGTGKGLVLNNTSAMYTSSDVFPTVDSTKFIQGSEVYSGGSNVTYIAYCFHSVEGYSKVGSYTGNGSSDGTFVYTGFRPAYVMFKKSSAAEGWYIFDTERNEHNEAKTQLRAHESGAEGVSTGGLDLLSNGFKIRRNHDYINASGGTYIYLAFAETPFKYTNAR